MVTDIYEINSETCALIPENGQTTKIINGSKILTQPQNINTIVNYSCEYYGSSFDGRVKGSKAVLGMRYKLPIIIEESRELIFFPTTSYDNEKCAWISLQNISSYEQAGKSKNKTKIVFKSGVTINYPISYESFENQLLRATRLLLILKNRKENEQK